MVNLDVDVCILSFKSHTKKYGSELIKIFGGDFTEAKISL